MNTQGCVRSREEFDKELDRVIHRSMDALQKDGSVSQTVLLIAADGRVIEWQETDLQEFARADAGIASDQEAYREILPGVVGKRAEAHHPVGFVHALASMSVDRSFFDQIQKEISVEPSEEPDDERIRQLAEHAAGRMLKPRLLVSWQYLGRPGLKMWSLLTDEDGTSRLEEIGDLSTEEGSSDAVTDELRRRIQVAPQPGEHGEKKPAKAEEDSPATAKTGTEEPEPTEPPTDAPLETVADEKGEKADPPASTKTEVEDPAPPLPAETEPESERPRDTVPEKAEEEAPTEEDDSSEWSVGDLIDGRFEVQDVHEAGAMGRVYRVFHRDWNMDLAVKTPRPEHFGTARARENFIREAETWVNIGMHPHIVTCYYVRTVDEVPRVFAEYIEGGSLTDWIKSRKLYEGGEEKALPRMLDIAIQFAWGLAYAHDRGLVHQDVKPGNLMLAPDGTAMVTDFGLSRAHDLASREGPGRAVEVTAGGLSPAYCSPEQAASMEQAKSGVPREKRPKLTPKTDLWSWAVSVLEMFTGGVTWMAGQAAPKVLDALEKNHAPEGIPAMPGPVRDLLAECFHRPAGERPDGMAAVAERLAQIYGEVAGEPYPRKRPDEGKLIADSLNNMGVSRLDLGNPEGALESFREALKSDPAHAAANANFAVTAWKHWDLAGLESVQDVERHLNEAVSRERSPLTLAARAWFRLQLGQAEEALYDSEGALDLGAPAIRLKARALSLLARPDEAARLLEESIGEHPESEGDLLHDLARARLASRPDEPRPALSVMEQAAAVLGHDTPHALTDLAVLRTLADDGTGAMEAFERAVENHPDCPYALLRFGEFLIDEGGDYREGVRLLHQALELCPGLEPALRILREFDEPCDVPWLHGEERPNPSYEGTCAQDDAWLLLPASIPEEHVEEPLEGAGDFLVLTSDHRYAVAGGRRHVQIVPLEEEASRHVIPGFVLGIAPSEHLLLFTEPSEIRTAGSGPVPRRDEEPRAGTSCALAFEGDKARVLCIESDGGSLVNCALTVGELRSLFLLAGGAPSAIPDKELIVFRGFAPDLRKCYYATDAHNEPIVGVDEMKDGKYQRSEEVHHWRHSDRIRSLSVSEDGTYVLTGSLDRTLRVWDASMPTGDSILTLKGHAAGVTGGVLLSDGRRAVSTGLDGTIRVWDLLRGRPIRIISRTGASFSSVRATPDGSRIVALEKNGKIRVLDSEDPGQWLSAPDIASVPILVQPSSPAEVLQARDDVRHLMQEAETRKPLEGLELLRTALREKGQSRSAEILDRIAEIGEPLGATGLRDCWTRKQHDGEGGAVVSVDFAPDSRRVLIGMSGRLASLHELDSPDPVHRFSLLEECGAVAVAPDGRTGVATRRRTVEILNLETGQVMGTWKALGGDRLLKALAYSPDGTCVFAGGDDLSNKGHVFAFDFERPSRAGDGASEEGRPLGGCGFADLALSSDGATLATVDTDGSLQAWTVHGAEPAMTDSRDTGGEACCVAFRPGSRQVVTGTRMGSVYLWDLRKRGEPIRKFAGLEARVRSISVSPDGNFAALACGSRILLLNLVTGTSAEIGRHQDEVLSVRFAPNGRMVASGGSDHRLTVWEIDWHYRGEPGAPVLPDEEPGLEEVEEADLLEEVAPAQTGTDRSEAETEPEEAGETAPVGSGSASLWISNRFYPRLPGPGAFRFLIVILIAMNAVPAFYPSQNAFAAVAGTAFLLGLLFSFQAGAWKDRWGYIVVFPILLLVGAWAAWGLVQFDRTGWMHRHVLLSVMALMTCALYGLWRSGYEWGVVPEQMSTWTEEEIVDYVEQVLFARPTVTAPNIGAHMLRFVAEMALKADDPTPTRLRAMRLLADAIDRKISSAGLPEDAAWWRKKAAELES